LEERLGAALPTDYRQFILQYNGGFFSEPEIASPDEDCPPDCLTDLWGIGAPARHAELGDDTDLFDDNFPTKLLPIGYTLSGNLLLTVTRKDEDHGCIFLKLKYSSDYFFLGATMDEFFKLLRAGEAK